MFFRFISKILLSRDVKNRIFSVFSFILIYRFAIHLTLPGLDVIVLKNFTESFSPTGILGLLNAFTGGAFSGASILALGVMPYISASIVMQLLTIGIPYFQKIQSDGEYGSLKIKQITRCLTVIICLFQAPGYVYGFRFFRSAS